MEALVYRVDQMGDGPMIERRKKPKKIIGETVRKVLFINILTVTICKDRTCYCELIHIIYPT